MNVSCVAYAVETAFRRKTLKLFSYNRITYQIFAQNRLFFIIKILKKFSLVFTVSSETKYLYFEAKMPFLIVLAEINVDFSAS